MEELIEVSVADTTAAGTRNKFANISKPVMQLRKSSVEIDWVSGQGERSLIGN